MSQSYQKMNKEHIIDLERKVADLQAENERIREEATPIRKDYFRERIIEVEEAFAAERERADKAEADLSALRKLLTDAPVRYLQIGEDGVPELFFRGKSKGICYELRDSHVLMVAQGEVERIVKEE